MLSLAKASEQYSQYMLGSLQDAVAPAPADPAAQQRFRSGQFSVTLRELIAYYVAMVSRLSGAPLHGVVLCYCPSVLCAALSLYKSFEICVQKIAKSGKEDAVAEMCMRWSGLCGTEIAAKCMTATHYTAHGSHIFLL